MTDDIFSGEPQQEPENKEASFEERMAQQLASIKREDGSQMFDSVEKALESLAHAQKIIPELKNTLKAKEEEATELKTQLEKAATVEDVLSRINNSPKDTNDNSGVEKVKNEDIGELVKQELNKAREAERILSNREQVNSALIAKFGDADKAKLALDSKAKELGVGVEFLASMADKSPKALLAYFNSSPQGGVTNPTTTSVNLRKGDEPNRSSDLQPFSLSNTNSSDQLEMMKKIKASVYQKYEVVA